jgi:hypothetical protein
MKRLLGIGLLGFCVIITGSVNASDILTDAFNGGAVDPYLWTSSGNSTVSSGYLWVNSGGYVQSINSASVLKGDLDVTFAGVKTENWAPPVMSMGLYSTGGQYVYLNQSAGNCMSLEINGPNGTSYYLFNWPSPRNISGKQLWNTTGQTWRVVLTNSSLAVYVDDALQVSLSEGEVMSYPYGGGTVSIPTSDLFVKFQGDASGNFMMDGITFSTSYEFSTSAPVFSPAGPYIDSASPTVTITCATSGASIYYTTDGKTPTASGTAYLSPTTVVVSDGMTLKAIAAVGSDTSLITTQKYSFINTLLTDKFGGACVDPSLWTSSGNSTVSSGYLRVNSGGYVQSINSASVSDGTIDITFTGVGTENWGTNDMSMGLYSADGSQYVDIQQPGYSACTVVRSVGASSDIYQRLAWAPWGQSGAELRSVGGQTWRMVLTATSIDVYVDGTSVVSLSQSAGTLASGSIPTGDLFVKFQGNAAGNFIMDGIDFLTTYKPATSAPVFDPVGPVTSDSPITLTMTSPTSGASIYYTMDGSNPTTESTHYTGPITISSEKIIKAIAVKTDTSWITAQSYKVFTPIFTDSFDQANGISIDTTLWESYGLAMIESGYLKTASGGYVQSIKSASVQDGTLDVTFTDVGTESWDTNDMSMGLYSADGSQYVYIDQPGYSCCTSVQIKGPNGLSYYYLSWTPWGITGKELRCVGGQTWRLVLTSDSLSIYVDDVLQVTLPEGDEILGTGSGTVSIPTEALAVRFQGDSASTFIMDGVVFSSAYVPETAAPTFDPSDAKISGESTVTISSVTAGAAIYYTTDGSTPTVNGTAYSNPTTVTVRDGMTLKAIAAVGTDISWTTGQTYRTYDVSGFKVYYEDFNETEGTLLNGLTPDVGVDTWIASSSLLVNASGQAATNGLTGYLPFTPQNGYLYSLSADVHETAEGYSSYIGFAQSANTGSADWTGSTVNPTGWMSIETSGNGNMYAGPSTANQVGTYFGRMAGVHNLRIDLDTRGGSGNWTLTYYCDDVLKGGPVAYPASGTIKYVSFGGSCSGSSATIDNFKLTARIDGISRGRAALLYHGLQIQSDVHTADPPAGPNIDIWAEANFTTFLPWHNVSSNNPLLLAEVAAAGRQWCREDYNAKYLLPYEMQYLDTFVCMQYQDELTQSAEVMADEKLWFDTWKVMYPNALAYTNFGSGMSKSTISTFMQTTDPDMIMFDLYPNFNFAETNRNSWYAEMQTYRLAGLAGNNNAGTLPIPYAQWLLMYRPTYSDPLPSESYIRVQQFASWTFGYTLLNAFTYNTASGSGVPVLFSAAGSSSKTVVFDYLAETNRQSLNLGPALVRLVSTDLRMVMGQDSSGTTNDTPSDITTGISSVTGSYLTGVSVMNLGSKNGGKPGDVIIGFFKPLSEVLDGSYYTNQQYFMVTNALVDGPGTASSSSTANATQQKIQLTFNFGSSGITSLQRLSRTTGQVETVSLVSDGGGVYHLDLTLDGGTGDLFKYNTGAPFVGVDSTSITGDFNGDGLVNATDIDLLFAAINSHSTSYATYDLTKDGKINSADMDYLITTILHTYYGDADLNHSVGVSDLSVLAAYYNTPSGASWANGDFDGNGAVGVSDLSILAANYNSGSASTVSWAEAYAQAFGTTSDADETTDASADDSEDTTSSVCSSLGLSLIAGLALMGLMMVKMKE